MDSTELNDSLKNIALEYTEALKDVLGENLRAVVLFGSVARKEGGPLSDIDLLVVAEGLPSGRFSRQQHVQVASEKIEPRLQALRKKRIWTDLCPVLKTPEEARHLTPLYLDLLEDGVVLYDKGGYFASILDRLRHSLESLGSRRRKRGKVRYWELKPDYRPGEIFEI